jgi:hypothetical protein
MREEGKLHNQVVSTWQQHGIMHIPCTFHAHSMRPSVLGPTRLELLKVTPHCGIPLLCEVFSARPSCVFFAGQLRSPAEHLSTILLSAVCLLERTCGFHASLLQDAFRIKFELLVTTWETFNHLCALQELAVFMEARYPAELLWHTRDIDLSTVQRTFRRGGVNLRVPACHMY